jgi:AraC-like DNA-binding protein
MVCNRCITAVKNILDGLNFQYASIQLGEVALSKEPTDKQLSLFKDNLQQLGFELLDDAKKKLIENIKTIIIEHVHYKEGDEQYNLSEILSSKMRKDYSYLSHLFSEVEGVTIEKYLINQKVERIKELLVYDELSLNEIAYQLGYSSVAHLSSQFKKVTGLTPTHFKKMGGIHRKPLDNV